MAGTIHIVGAGLAGLSCAVELASAGMRVVVHEAAGQGGGRCRSYRDDVLGAVVDNGNHLLLSGNVAVAAYLDRIGSQDALTGPARASFPFFDLQTGERWTFDIGESRLPFWIFDPARRVPGTAAVDYLKGIKFAFAAENDTVAGLVGDGGNLYRRFWEPMAVAVLNAAADEGAAHLLWPVLRETFGKGGHACRPLIAATGLSAAFVDPALAFLAARGGEVRFNDRLRAVVWKSGTAAALSFADGETVLGDSDAVVFAVPPVVARDLLPEIAVPEGSRAIVNGHFLLPSRGKETSFMGLIGGLVQWLFVRGDTASVTVSAADAVVDRPAEDLAAEMWPEVARALDLGPGPLPTYRIVKEKRATFAQVPENLRRRPGAQTAWPNVFLAGDWTATGLPATIEGAIRSGRTAAAAAIRRARRA